MIVDIVITTYNRAKILPGTLKSVQSQTYPDWRCWIAEDGKTIETQEAVAPFLKDARFIYLPGDHAGRPAPPRNRAMLEGNAELIAFLDDDDRWLPEKLERQVRLMQDHPDCVLSGCNAYKLMMGEELKDTVPLYFRKKSFFGRVRYEKFVQQNYIILSSAMIRRAALARSGRFNEKLSPAEDYELWLRIGVLGTIWNMADPLVIYSDSVSAKHYPKLDRQQSYHERARVLDFALTGDGHVPSPLTSPGYERYAAACRYEKKFYLGGPRFLGRLRHELAWKIRERLSPL